MFPQGNKTVDFGSNLYRTDRMADVIYMFPFKNLLWNLKFINVVLVSTF